MSELERSEHRSTSPNHPPCCRRTEALSRRRTGTRESHDARPARGCDAEPERGRPRPTTSASGDGGRARCRPRLGRDGQPKKRRRRGSRGGRGRKKPGTGTGAASRCGGRRRRPADDPLIGGSEDWTGGPPIAASPTTTSPSRPATTPGSPHRRRSACRGAPGPDAPATAAEAARRRHPAGHATRPGIGRAGCAGLDRRRAQEAPAPAGWAGPQQDRRRASAPTAVPVPSAARSGRRRTRRRALRRRGRAADRRRRRRHRAARVARQRDAARRRSGSHRKGRPAGRYLMVVHQRDDGIAHIAVLEGRTLVEHYVSMPTDDTLSIDGNIYLGRVQNVLPGMEAAFIDIGTPKNGVLYRGDVDLRPRRRGGRPAAAHRERAAQRPVDHRAGHQEPDRAQGRAPHAGGEPRGPVRGDGARRSRRPTASRSGSPTTSASACARCSTGCGRPTPGSSCAPRPKARPRKSSSATCCASTSSGARSPSSRRRRSRAASSTRSRRSRPA